MKRTWLTKVFIVGVLFVLLPMVGFCGPKKWVGTTSSWNTPGNWSPSGVPGVGDDVTFDNTSNFACTININVSINSITVNGYTSTITQSTGTTITTANVTTTTNTFTTGTFSGSVASSALNDITFNGSLLINGGTFISTQASLYIKRNFTLSSGGSFGSNNGTVVFSPTAAIVSLTSTSPWTLYNAIFIGNGNRINLITSTLTVSNLLTLGSAASFSATNISIPPGITANALQILEGGGSLAYINILNGTIAIIGTTGVYSLSVNNPNVGVSLPTITNPDIAGTIQFSGTSNQQIVSAAALVLSSGSYYPSAILPNMIINKSFGTLDLGTGTIFLSGNWTYLAGTVSPSSSTVYFYNNTGSQTITTVNGANSMNLFNLTVDTPTLLQGSNVYLKGNLSGTAGDVLDPSASNYNISLEGNWNFLGTYNSPTNRTPTVTFTGTNNQNISASVTPFYNLTINKGSNNVTLGTSVTVSNVLTLTQGNLKTSSASSYLLTLNAPGSSIVGGTGATAGLGSALSYVDGPTVWNINVSGTATYNYPIGAGGDWSPLSLSIGKGSSSQTLYTAEVKKVSPITTFPSYTLGTGIKKISNVRYWVASQSGAAASSVRPNAFFNANDQVTDPLPASLSLATVVGTTWTNISTTTTTYAAPVVSPYSGNVLVGADRVPTATDYYTFDDVGTNINPLPITLSSFKAAFDNTGTLVNVLWTTESEEAGTYFTLERADKSLSFEALTTVKPAYGDGKNGREEYSYVDRHPLNGLSYYRLKQTNIKGEVSYNTIVSVNSTIEIAARVYPNPGDGNAMRLLIPSVLRHEDNVTLTIRNQLDEVVTNETIVLDGKDEIEFHMVSPLPAGIYYVSFGGGGIFYSMKYMVR